jgi:hypothetical protein
MLKRFNNLSGVAGRFNIGHTHVLDIMALTFDRVGRLAAVGGTFGEGRATLFESGEKMLRELENHARMLYAVAFSADGQRVAMHGRGIGQI